MFIPNDWSKSTNTIFVLYFDSKKASIIAIKHCTHESSMNYTIRSPAISGAKKLYDERAKYGKAQNLVL